MNDQELKELRIRNEKRIQEMKEKMGNKYLLHPSNFVQRKPDHFWSLKKPLTT